MDKYFRACLAELIGTFFLTFIGGGAIVTSAMLEQQGQTGTGLLGIAFAHGLALAIAVTATMNISGGHINPAVTITLWMYKRITGDRAIAYVLAQLLGAIIAGGLIVLVFTSQGQTGALQAGGYGAPHVAGFIKETSGSGWQVYAWGVALEIILTFLLVFAVFGTAVDPRAPNVGGFAIGLTVAADILMGGPLTGAAMNPARAFGPALWQGAIMGWHTLWDQGIYWIGPIIGGILAGGLYVNYVLPQEEPKHPPTHHHS